MWLNAYRNSLSHLLLWIRRHDHPDYHFPTPFVLIPRLPCPPPFTILTKRTDFILKHTLTTRTERECGGRGRAKRLNTPPDHAHFFVERARCAPTNSTASLGVSRSDGRGYARQNRRFARVRYVMVTEAFLLSSEFSNLQIINGSELFCFNIFQLKTEIIYLSPHNLIKLT